MMSNEFLGSGGPYAWPSALALGAGMFDWRNAFSGLPEEVKAYLTEHESEIRDESDVARLIRIYDLKK